MSRMNLQSLTDPLGLKKRFIVILVRPENPENIGLVARNMKNTGFEMLRLVQVAGISPKSRRTAVHSLDILERACLYADLKAAVEDLQIVFAATSKRRKNFPSLSLKEAVAEMFRFPASTRIGLLFGNERTGLTSEEMRCSNFRIMIPQSGRQPSYNLASAVLLTLFHVFTYQNLGDKERAAAKEEPLRREEQEECIRLVLDKLEKKRFIHETNRLHMTEMVYDLFGRLTLTAKDRKLILALFSKAIGD
jgi:TrmH family RNA methyltransferase